MARIGWKMNQDVRPRKLKTQNTILKSKTKKRIKKIGDRRIAF